MSSSNKGSSDAERTGRWNRPEHFHIAVGSPKEEEAIQGYSAGKEGPGIIASASLKWLPMSPRLEKKASELEGY